jgi:hypothetical protein
MTYTVKHRGDRTATIVCVYTCEVHGEMEVEVQRDENGSAPDTTKCRVLVDSPPHEHHDGRTYVFRGYCDRPSTWTPQPITCRVKRFEVVRGGWEKPERKTFLDTRELGEGQSMEEFQKKRKAVWDEKRKRDVMEIKKGFY